RHSFNQTLAAPCPRTTMSTVPNARSLPMSRTSLPGSNGAVRSSSLTVAVVGVTGNIGSRVAHALADAGHNVIGLARNPENASRFRVVSVDLRNEAEANAAVQGADA